MPFGGALTTGLIGLGGSIFGGIMGANASKKAAAIQAAAAKEAGQKVEQTAWEVNPMIGNAAASAGADVNLEAARAASGVASAADRSNALLSPWANTGQHANNVLDVGLETGGEFNKTPTMADIQIDPGFAFRLQQAQLALDRGAAARGGVMSGGALKGMDRFSQNLASEEYGNAFQRYMATRQANYNNLFNLSNSGQAAATRQGETLYGAGVYGGNAQQEAQRFAGTMGYDAASRMASNQLEAASKYGDYLTQAGNARASGEVGQANAWGNAFGGAASSANNALLLSKLLNPTISSGGGAGDGSFYVPNYNPNYGANAGLPAPPSIGIPGVAPGGLPVGSGAGGF